MKILILSTLLIASIFGQACQTYTCGSLTAPACVHTAQDSKTTNVQVCPSNQYCNAIGAFGPGVVADSSCANNPTNNDPVNSLAPGDYCNADRKDVCANTKTTTCKSSVCTTTNDVGGDCSLDSDCMVGQYCNIGATPKICAKIIAPGQTCALMGQQTLTQPASQCGYGGYCINSKCTLLYSLASGADTGVPSATAQTFAAQLCQTAAADNTGGLATWKCVAANKNKDASTLTTGVTMPATCTVVNTLANGETKETTSPAQCGYNQNANGYCPWQLGDAPVSTLLPAVTKYFSMANTMCNPATVICNAVYTKKIPGALSVVQLTEIVGGNNLTPFVANNADCVKKTITATWWGESSIVKSFSVVAALALLF